MSWSYDFLRNASNVVLIVGLFLAALGTFGVNFFRAKLEKQRETRQAEREGQREAREALLGSQVDELVAGNKRLEAAIQPFAELATQRFPGVSQEEALSRLREDIEAVRRRAEDLERAVAPRRLSAEQRASVAVRLRDVPKAPVFIVCLSGNAESCAFAADVARALREAGFAVEVQDQILFGASPEPPRGLFMVLKRDEVPACAPALQEAFHAVGVELGAYPSDNADFAGRVQMTVGVKPQ